MAARCYVDAAATGPTHDGAAWASAYTDLQLALADASCAEVWVAQGIYTPVTVAGDQDISFNIRPGVAVYGGFASVETTLGARDSAAHVTILSGDIDNNDDSNNADGNWHRRNQHRYRRPQHPPPRRHGRHCGHASHRHHRARRLHPDRRRQHQR
ncbi:MAG TPA: hypothetical protein VFG73_06275 [Rhodanobacteraceae bacterium]|nr:hypothetical protein [Rhodanobacteraceae bacterium]